MTFFCALDCAAAPVPKQKSPDDPAAGASAIDEETQTVAFCEAADHRIGVHHTIAEDIAGLRYLGERSAGPQRLLETPPGFSDTYAGLYSPTGKRSDGVYVALLNEYCSDIRPTDFLLFLKANAGHFSAAPAEPEGCRSINLLDEHFGPKNTKGLLCVRSKILLLVTARVPPEEDGASGERLSAIAEAYLDSSAEKLKLSRPARCVLKGGKPFCRDLTSPK